MFRFTGSGSGSGQKTFGSLRFNVCTADLADTQAKLSWAELDVDLAERRAGYTEPPELTHI